jgi:AmiR/NasT family two-component response regulator
VPTLTGQPRRPRVLIARVSPVAALGMREGLAHDVEIVGEEGRELAVEAVARSLAPDAIVLARESEGSHGLCNRIRVAVPGAKVILWQESQMGVMDPGAGVIRWVPSGGVPDLLRELVDGDSKQLKE